MCVEVFDQLAYQGCLRQLAVERTSMPHMPQSYCVPLFVEETRSFASLKRAAHTHIALMLVDIRLPL
jgi:hypothetical protein